MSLAIEFHSHSRYGPCEFPSHSSHSPVGSIVRAIPMLTALATAHAAVLNRNCDVIQKEKKERRRKKKKRKKGKTFYKATLPIPEKYYVFLKLVSVPSAVEKCGWNARKVLPFLSENFKDELQLIKPLNELKETRHNRRKEVSAWKMWTSIRTWHPTWRGRCFQLSSFWMWLNSEILCLLFPISFWVFTWFVSGDVSRPSIASLDGKQIKKKKTLHQVGGLKPSDFADKLITIQFRFRIDSKPAHTYQFKIRPEIRPEWRWFRMDATVSQCWRRFTPKSSKRNGGGEEFQDRQNHVSCFEQLGKIARNSDRLKLHAMVA